MAEQSSSFPVRFVRGVWRTIDVSRRFVLNLIFVLIVVWIITAIVAGAPKLEPDTALVIAPQGAIVEQYSASPADRALARMFGEEVEEMQLRDILAALDAAAKDSNIKRVVIVPDTLTSAGMSTLIEVGAALDRFRASGKEVIAYADAMEQRGYYLAAHADKVYLNPDGAVLLEGMGRYRTYFRSAFEKLGVEARLFRVGEYKSAGEPYIRDDQSPEARQADLFWMNDLWQRYLGDIAKLRKIDAAKLVAQIEGYDTEIARTGGDLAKLAQEQGLVDELKTRDEVRAILIESGAEDHENHTFRQIGLEDYANRIAMSKLPLGKPQLAVVVAEGEIVDGEQPPGMVGGDSTAYLIRKAREDDQVKALVLRVDSPGGSVFPSELIRREIELTKKAGKPVVVSMGDVAASGGYWISMNADTIIASPSTITGSIGIFGLWFNASEGMSKLGLTNDGVGTTWIAGAINPTRAYDERLGAIIQSVIDKGYRDFIGKVAAARGKAVPEIDRVARGRVWSGAQAKERGLVDTLGTFHDALAQAAKRASLTDYDVQYVEKELSPFETVVVDMTRSSFGRSARDAGIVLPSAWLPPSALGDVIAAQRIVADALRRRPFAVYAHCECTGF